MFKVGQNYKKNLLKLKWISTFLNEVDDIFLLAHVHKI